MSEISEGTWSGKVKDWEIVSVEKLDGQLKLVIWFHVWGNGWAKDMKWEGFFLKKDGTKNKKTYDTLATCGFSSSDIGDLVDREDALDKSVTHNVQVVQNDGYWNVDWVGVTSSVGAITDKTILKGHNLSKLNSFLGPAKPKCNGSSDTEIDDFLNT